MGLRLGLGIGLSPGGGQSAPWSEALSLIDADFAHNLYRYNGQDYADETAWLTAIGGTKSGITRSIGPYVFGAELLSDPGFGSGVDSWADAPAYAANGDVSVVSGALRLLYTGAATTYRARRAVSVTADHAYKFDLLGVSHVALTSASINGSTNTDLSGSAQIFFTLGSLPQAKSLVMGPQTSTLYVGVACTGTAAGTTRIDVDDASVKEVYPYAGYVVGSVAARIKFTTPASVAVAEVLAQWGDDSERQRVRLQLGTDLHLHLIITRNNSQLDDVDLGACSASTAHVAEITFAPGRVVARLLGNVSKNSVSTTIPGIGKLWIARSFTGETFNGTVERVTIWAVERLPDDGLWVEGDSYAAGAGGVSMTVTAKADGRGALTTAVAGTTLADQLVRVDAKPGLKQSGVFIHWDGSTAGNVDVATAMASYRAMVAGLGHSRFVIVAPVRLAIASGATNQLASDVTAALLAEWPDNVVDAQTILASHATSPGDDANVAGNTVPDSLLQGDDTHLTSTGMGYVWTEGVKPILTANGW